MTFNATAARSSLLRTAMVPMLALGFVAADIAPVKADPPPWAPAHGYRDKQMKKGKGKKNKGYYAAPVATVPFGIDVGECNRELLGSVLGATVGGVAGSQIGKGDGKLVAVAGGTIIGYLLGGAIGRSMDEVDQNCIGQTMEHAEDGQQIVWNNPQNGAEYEISPERTYQQQSGEYCREYTAEADIDGKIQKSYGIACRQVDGSWKLMN
ncbi:RT0821/Lpp0805 family surface protein [uncultured Sneathiella sp.]|uniref:RT0821/Lpp0805 family surface protein n=1 Tax=uncultured Sneathiella sp. TaxID=879315 RepID=UPI0030EFA0AD